MSEATEIEAGSAALTRLGGALAQSGAASLTGQREQLAEGLLRESLTRWEDPQLRPQLLGEVLAAITTEAGAARMREFLSSQIFSQLGKELDSSKTRDIHQVAEILKVPPLNINAAQAQVWGVIILRYILQIEPIASAPADEILDTIAPTIQRYLAG
ncbi:hypothetical protein ABZ471_43600 [Streptomyces sp. NPDC005728]|uniref:TetR/AcrR family transcriptional regulator n=1 Tax=Streptomyces sp. NPDC005728 TaxID=3157054 RepID=UPI003409CF83